MKDRAKRKEAVSAAGNPVLIVCPSSVVQSWEDHLRKWGYFESESITESTGRGSGSMEVTREQKKSRETYIESKKNVKYNDSKLDVRKAVSCWCMKAPSPCHNYL